MKDGIDEESAELEPPPGLAEMTAPPPIHRERRYVGPDLRLRGLS